MNIKSILSSLLLAGALSLASCSEKDVIVDNPGDSPEQNQVGYLSINITSNGSTSRADEKYEDGSESESKVEAIRFYFFDDSGNAVSVKKSGEQMQSYLDVTDMTQNDDTNSSDDIESNISAMLLIDTKTGDKLPTQVVAVLNPTTELKSQDIINISDITDYTGNFSNDGNSLFVMSNSVYAYDGAKMDAVNVSANIKSSEDEAKKNPAIIYVERVNAKVEVSTDLKKVDGKEYYELKSKDATPTDLKIDEKTKLYLKIEGWDVTKTASKSRAMKEINPTWNLSWEWNGTHRSFWAINPSGLEYGIKSYNDHAKNEFSTTEKIVAVYPQENAAKDNTGANAETLTKVIVLGQIVDGDGIPQSFAQIGTTLYSKAQLLQLIVPPLGFYTDQECSKKLGEDEDDVIFVTNNSKAASGRYLSKMTLPTTEGQSKTYYKKGDDINEPATVDEINKALESLGTFKYYNNGLTYWYFDIAHLDKTGKGSGDYGLVRNHWYQSKITKIAGLGTPIPDDNDAIDPEQPDDPDSFIAAEIKVISWRIVSQDIDLIW